MNVEGLSLVKIRESLISGEWPKELDSILETVASVPFLNLGMFGTPDKMWMIDAQVLKVWMLSSEAISQRDYFTIINQFKRSDTEFLKESPLDVGKKLKNLNMAVYRAAQYHPHSESIIEFGGINLDAAGPDLEGFWMLEEKVKTKIPIKISNVGPESIFRTMNPGSIAALLARSTSLGTENAIEEIKDHLILPNPMELVVQVAHSLLFTEELESINVIREIL